MGSQKESSAYEKQLVALGRALQTVREGETIDALMDATLNYLKIESRYALIWIGLYDRLAHCLRGQSGLTPGGEAVPFLKKQLDLQPGDLLEQAVIQQRLIGVPNLRDEPRAGEWRAIATKFAIQGTLIFPIRYRNECMGIALLGSTLWGLSPQSDEKARLSMVLGELGAMLYQLNTEQQRQKVKNPAEPLLAMLQRLRSLPRLQQRLEAVVEETQRFIESDRTNVYWFDPQRRCFQRRLGKQKGMRGATEAGQGETPEISVEDVSSFYQALIADQLVVVGEAKNSLKADMTVRLMQKIRARSLLAAPILYQDRLFGFLSVEGDEGKIWTETEKNFLKGVAQLIAMTTPLEDMEETIQQIKLDQALTAEVSKAIYSSDDWNQTLKGCAEQVCHRLKVERFLVLLYDADQEKFEICYQNTVPGRKAVSNSVDRPNPVDWQMLERSTEAIAIENLADDLKLLTWRDMLQEMGVQSFLVCSTSLGKSLEGLVVVGHEKTRTWTLTERDLLRAVSQQVGVILHQWQLQRQSENQQKLYETIQWGLSAMQQIQESAQLEQAAMQQIATLLQVPLAALITWLPGHKTARISAMAIGNNKFTLTTERAIGVHTDLLVQRALQTDGMFALSSDELSTETQQWLSGSGIGQLLVIALRTSPDHEPTGIVLVSDHKDRFWSERQQDAYAILVDQLAWFRRYLLLIESLTGQRETLERLNWYKQRRIEEFYRTLGTALKRLNELSQQKDASLGMRYQQILRQLGDILSSIAPILKQEQWKIHAEYATIPLASLLRRSLERVDPLIKQRQIWSQVHNEEALIIGGDIPKIEFVLYEVLAFACRRSPNNGRLDLWCRPLDAQWLELSITDSGIIEPRLIEELHLGRPFDLLAPSTLDTPPGLHLAICQSLMQYLGGEFSLYVLEDNRVLSRLVIPIAATE